jgi:hypothetical protein
MYGATDHSNVCSVNECEKPFKAKGLCLKHYSRIIGLS